MSIVTELKYTANLDKGVCMTPITPSFMGGDQEAHRITVDCYRQHSREAVDLSGAGVTAYFVRADGMTIPLVGETNGSKASVLLPAACYAVMGRFSLVIKLSLDDGTADSINTVFWGEGAVSRSRTDVVIDPDSVIPSLEELLAQIAAMEIATKNANTAAENANQAAADALKTVDEAVARQDEVISQLSSEIAAPIPPERLTCFKQTKNIFTGWANDGYYVSQLDGKLFVNASHTASDYIAVKPNMSYVFSASNGGTYGDTRFALYDKHKTFISGAIQQPQFDTPDNAAYVRISMSKTGSPNPQLEEGTTATKYEPHYPPYLDWRYVSYRNPNNQQPMVEKLTKTSTTQKCVIQLAAYPNSIKQHRIINLYATTGMLAGAYIVLKDMSDNNIVRVAVNAEKVEVSNYMWGTPTVNTYDHGLTLSDHVGVKLEISMDKCKLVVSSNGATFTQEWQSLNRGLTYPLAQIDATAGEIVLDGSWTCADFEKKVWVYGDSYIQNDNTRWMYHLINDGYNKNCLIDGYSGAGSNGAMTSLKNTMTLGYVPKYIFWCMGMNDGADSDNTPSAKWMTNIEKLMAICEDYNIRPILATIPSVPNINHEAKNAWVRESGYQYVDFAAAVNATPEGVWLPGMLSSDNVHPAAPGGLALYHRVLSDFPQIMIG